MADAAVVFALDVIARRPRADEAIPNPKCFLREIASLRSQ